MKVSAAVITNTTTAAAKTILRLRRQQQQYQYYNRYFSSPSSSSSGLVLASSSRPLRSSPSSFSQRKSNSISVNVNNYSNLSFFSTNSTMKKKTTTRTPLAVEELPPPSPPSENNTKKNTTANNTIVDIEEIHNMACRSLSTTYIDPTTQFQVFTEIAHLHRGKCCGNHCRHCPYGWINVPPAVGQSKRTPKVTSGDTIAIQNLLEQYSNSAGDTATTASASTSSTQPTNADTITTTATANEEIAAPNTTRNKARTGGRHGGKLTSKNVPYTRGGDKGSSQLLTGERRPKSDDAFEAMGTVDELCSHVGVVHAHVVAENNDREDNDSSNNNNNNNSDMITIDEFQDYLLDIMSRLFDIGSHVAKPRKIRRRRRRQDDNDDGDSNSSSESDWDDTDSDEEVDGVGGKFDPYHIAELEEWIDGLTEEIPELNSFILPTGTVTASHLHVARTVCRRAERRVVVLGDASDPNVLRYLNRLSDFFFVAARWINYKHNDNGDMMNEIQYKRPERGAKQRHRVVVPKLSQQDDK